MQELDRIEHALAVKPLSHQLCERCAQDLLSEIYPGLTPISGGTDWGRDADIHASGRLPARLLATTARTLEGVRKNMLKGIASMKQHGVPFDRIILANCAQISQLQRHSLGESAKKQGAIVDAIYDQASLRVGCVVMENGGPVFSDSQPTLLRYRAYRVTWRKVRGLNFRL
jgi:hypothetical protein